MSKKSLLVFFIMLAFFATAVGFAAYSYGQSRRVDSTVMPTAMPTPVVEQSGNQTQLTGAERTISLLQDRQDTAYSLSDSAEFDGDIDYNGVYFAQYLDNNIIFTFGEFFGPDGEIIDNPNLGYVFVLNELGQSSDAVDFNDLDMPILIYTLEDVEAEEASEYIPYGNFVLDEEYIYFVASPNYYNPEVDLTDSTFKVYGFNIVDDELEIVVNPQPFDLERPQLLVAASQGYLMFDVLSCTSCDGGYELPTDLVVYNTVTDASIVIEGAGYKSLDASAGTVSYQLDVATTIECTPAEIEEDVLGYCGTQHYQNQGGETLTADLP